MKQAGPMEIITFNTFLASKSFNSTFSLFFASQQT